VTAHGGRFALPTASGTVEYMSLAALVAAERVILRYPMERGAVCSGAGRLSPRLGLTAAQPVRYGLSPPGTAAPASAPPAQPSQPPPPPPPPPSPSDPPPRHAAIITQAYAAGSQPGPVAAAAAAAGGPAAAAAVSRQHSGPAGGSGLPADLDVDWGEIRLGRMLGSGGFGEGTTPSCFAPALRVRVCLLTRCGQCMRATGAARPWRSSCCRQTASRTATCATLPRRLPS
jgi:hypothetical protein